MGPWREELRQLLLLLAEQADHRLHPLPWAQPIPIRVQARACREEVRAEVLAAFAVVDGRGAPRSHRDGVLWDEASMTDILFITLRKSEALFSPTTRYRNQDGRPGGITEPFRCLGFATYEGHEGERPRFVEEWRSAGGWSGRSRRRG